MRRLAFLLGLFLGRVIAPAIPPQVQVIPTPYIWQGSVSSYDNFSRYIPTSPLNGLRLGDPAHLGARFIGPYNDRLNAFGPYAWDDMLLYVNGVAVNGLNLGDGYWPILTTPYVDRQNAFPADTWDALTNYTAIVALQGLNGGTNNQDGVTWAGPYVDDAPGCGFFPGPTITLTGGIVTLQNLGSAYHGYIPLYNAIFVSFDGSMPGDTATPQNGSVSIATAGASPPAGCWSYDGPFTLPWTCTITAVGSAGCACLGPCSLTYDSAATTAFTLSLGETWSNNVIANGGAAPSAASSQAINTFGAAVNNGQLINETPSYLFAVNVFAPDNLIASTTPIIYAAGLQPWTAHSLVSGDLTINGLTGDAATKYLDTGIDSTTLTYSTLGMAVYAYATNGTGFDFGSFSNFKDFFIAANAGGLAFFSSGEVRAAIGVNPTSPGPGFYSVQRTASAVCKAYWGNAGNALAQIGATDTATSPGYASQTLYTLALQHPAGGPANFTSDTLSFDAVTAGLSLAQTTSLFAAAQAIRVSFGGGYR
jgi:hypothetical protein